MAEIEAQESDMEIETQETVEPAAKKISMEILARFMAPVRSVFEESIPRDKRTKRGGFKKLVEDLKVLGCKYLSKPDESNKEDPKYRPYRRLLKVMAIYSLEQQTKKGTSKGTTRDLLHTSTEYDDEQLAYIEECFDEKRNIFDYLRRTHQHCEHLANRDLYNFFELISIDSGNEVIDLGEQDGKFKVINRNNWRLKQYFHTNFFNSKKSKTKEKKDEEDETIDPYLILIKFIVDSALFGEKRKTTINFGSKGGDQRTVTMESFGNTAMFIQKMYKTWDKIAKYMGFSNIRDFMGYFLYYNRKTGKLQILASTRVFTEKGESVIPVRGKAGTRVHEVDRTNKPEDVDEAEAVAKTMGTERTKMKNGDMVKHMKKETFERLVDLASEFLYDLYNRGLSSDIVTPPTKSISDMLQPFIIPEDNSKFPERFETLSQHIMDIQKDISEAKQRANMLQQEETIGMFYGEKTKENKTTRTEVHSCEPNCKCIQVRRNVMKAVGNLFPKIMVSRPEDFIDNAEIHCTNDILPGEVQVILTDPCEYSLGEPNVRMEEINPIVHTSTKLLRKGGHAFVKTTVVDAGVIMRAFRAMKDEAGQSIFTVENHPIVLLTRPEQRRGGPGKQGPATTCVTVFMIHAIRNGLQKKKEALASTNITNKGHTDSLYHADTNVIDGALEKTEKEGTLERTENGYNISLSGAKEIIDRYSLPEDIIVDLQCEKGWTAVASTCLKEARLFFGGVANKTAKDKLDIAIADSLIYQVGRGEVTNDMGLNDDTMEEMKEVYKNCKYEDRYDRAYGLKSWMRLWKDDGELPMMSDIPPHILDYVTVMTSDLKFVRKKHLKTMSLMIEGIGGELAQIEAEEPLRHACTKFGVYIDKRSPYTKEGLRAVKGGEKGDKIGDISGIFIEGGWRNNKRTLQDLGTGLFEYDEYAVKNKCIPIETTNLDRGENTKKTEDEDEEIGFIPAKFCPFRYARFSSLEGNVEVRIKKGAKQKTKLKHLHKPQMMEVIILEKILPGHPITMKITE